jgi:hypothetical protein
MLYFFGIIISFFILLRIVKCLGKCKLSFNNDEFMDNVASPSTNGMSMDKFEIATIFDDVHFLLDEEEGSFDDVYFLLNEEEGSVDFEGTQEQFCTCYNYHSNGEQ